MSKDGILRSFMIVALPAVASFDGRAIKEHKHNVSAKFPPCYTTCDSYDTFIYSFVFCLFFFFLFPCLKLNK